MVSNMTLKHLKSEITAKLEAAACGAVPGSLAAFALVSVVAAPRMQTRVRLPAANPVKPVRVRMYRGCPYGVDPRDRFR